MSRIVHIASADLHKALAGKTRGDFAFASKIARAEVVYLDGRKVKDKNGI